MCTKGSGDLKSWPSSPLPHTKRVPSSPTAVLCKPPAAAAIAFVLPPPELSAALTRVQLAPLVCSWLTSFSGFKSRRSDKVPHYTFASPLVCRIAGLQSTPTFSLALFLSLPLSRAPRFRHITPQQGGADTAANGAQWCPAGSCQTLPLSAACSDLASGLGCAPLPHKDMLGLPAGGADTDRRERLCVVVL